MATNPVKRHYTYGIKDFYNIFKKRHKKEGISYKAYKGFLVGIFGAFMRDIIQKRWTFDLPLMLGSIMIKSRKESRKSLDYKKTNLAGRPIFHKNEHSFGRVYRFFWYKGYRTRFKNKKLYKFLPAAGKELRKKGLGKGGLVDYIKDTANDPYKKLLP